MKKIDFIEPTAGEASEQIVRLAGKLNELIDWQNQMVSRMEVMYKFDWVLHTDLTKLEALVEEQKQQAVRESNEKAVKKLMEVCFNPNGETLVGMDAVAMVLDVPLRNWQTGKLLEENNVNKD